MRKLLATIWCIMFVVFVAPCARAAADWDWESDSGVYVLLDDDVEQCIFYIYEHTYCEYCDWWDFGCDCDPDVDDVWTFTGSEAGHKEYETVTLSGCWGSRSEATAAIQAQGGFNAQVTQETEGQICFSYQLTKVKACTHE